MSTTRSRAQQSRIVQPDCVLLHLKTNGSLRRNFVVIEIGGDLSGAGLAREHGGIALLITFFWLASRGCSNRKLVKAAGGRRAKRLLLL